MKSKVVLLPCGEYDEEKIYSLLKQGLDLLGVIPQDEAVYEYDCDGKPIIQIPKDSPVRKALYEILDKLNF